MEEPVVDSTVNLFFDKTTQEFHQTGKLKHYSVSVTNNGESTFFINIGDYCFDKKDVDALVDRMALCLKDKPGEVIALRNLFENCFKEKNPAKTSLLETKINQNLIIFEIQNLLSKIEQYREPIDKAYQIAEHPPNGEPKNYPVAFRLMFLYGDVVHREGKLSEIRKKLASIDLSKSGSLEELENLKSETEDFLISFSNTIRVIDRTPNIRDSEKLNLSYEQEASLFEATIPLMIERISAHDGSQPLLQHDAKSGFNLLHTIVLYGSVDHLEHLKEKLKGHLLDYIDTAITGRDDLVPLRIAVDKKELEKVSWLLDQGATINHHRDTMGKNLFFIAIKGGNLAIVQKFLEKKSINTETKDIYGNTYLHAAASLGNCEILKFLLNQKDFKNQRDALNIFGESPLDLALENKNDEAIRLLTGDDTLDPSKLAGYGVKKVDINQMNIIDNMVKYIKLKGRDPSDFEVFSEGNCVGFSTLLQFYISRGKEEEFYHIINLFASWDGDSGFLSDTNCVQGLSGNYKDFEDLIEQWINDVRWFQRHSLDSQPSIKIAQGDLLSLYEMVNNVNSKDQLHILIEFNRPKGSNFIPSTINKAQLIELLEIFKMIPNSSINLHAVAPRGHQTSLRILADGTYQYFDSNIPARIANPIQAAEELAEIISDNLFLSLGHSTTEMPFGFAWYHFSEENEPMKGLQRASLSVNQSSASSPNSFSMLTKAVILQDSNKVTELLGDPSTDINHKDKLDRSALDWAISTKNREIISIFLTSPKLILSEAAYEKCNELATELDDEAFRVLLQEQQSKIKENLT